MRRLVQLLLIAGLIVSLAWTAPAPRPVLDVADPATITATPVPLDPGDPAHVRVGALTFLGGMELTSPDAAFGGYSSLLVGGGDFTLLSDGGNLAWFRLAPGLRVEGARFGDLPAGPGNPRHKYNRDSESMTVDPATGRVWVGFEHRNAIFRYAPGFTAGEGGVAPAPMRGWSDNGGPESLVRLRDGRFLTIAETDRRPHSGGARNALIFATDPVAAPDRWIRFGYIPPNGFDPSDAAQLPDGRILVLNRRFALPFRWSAALTLIDLKDARPGAILTGTEIARLEAPLSVDNFEGLAIRREHGTTVLWLVSDDNLFQLQRTLLFKFRLDLPQTPPARVPGGKRAGNKQSGG